MSWLPSGIDRWVRGRFAALAASAIGAVLTCVISTVAAFGVISVARSTVVVDPPVRANAARIVVLGLRGPDLRSAATPLTSRPWLAARGNADCGRHSWISSCTTPSHTATTAPAAFATDGAGSVEWAARSGVTGGPTPTPVAQAVAAEAETGSSRPSGARNTVHLRRQELIHTLQSICHLWHALSDVRVRSAGAADSALDAGPPS